MRIVMALSWGDLRNITRDAMLLGAVIGPLVLAAFLRFGMLWAEALVWDRFAIDLSTYQPFVLSMMLQMVPLLIGMLVGFLILEERDEGVLDVLAVTPLSKSGYLLYRLGSPVVINVLLSFLALALSGMTSFSVGSMMPLVVLMGLEAPIIALFLAAVAANKVEGLALSKVTSVLLVAPLVCYFLDSQWGLLAGLLPSYWVMKAFLAVGAGQVGDFWLFTVVAAVYHGALLLFLIGRFRKRVG